MTRYTSYPLHERTEYQDACADILNAEWPRSRAARLHVLRKSSDDFPYNIAFVSINADGAENVVGHSRLSRVQGDDRACFVESVIIRKDLRGKGLGRLLMTETENHALRLGLCTVYLTTHDQQKFYERVGYDFCDPIIHIGSCSVLKKDLLNKLFGNSPSKPGSTSTSLKKNSLNGDIKPTDGPDKVAQGLVEKTDTVSTPPVPPPPPVLNTESKSFPAPPPPPPPAVSGKHTNSNTGGKQPTITRLANGEVSWMKKVLT